MTEQKGFDLEALVASRVKRANMQHQALQVLQGKDKEVTSMCEDLADHINKLKCDISELKEISNAQKQQNIALKEKQAELETTFHRIEYIENNLPAQFTSQLKSLTKKKVLRNGCAGDNGSPTPRQIRSEKRNGTHIPKLTSTNGTAVPLKRDTKPALCQLVKDLTQDEFDNMPSYLKGRAMLTYTSVNKFINYINTALVNKYRIIHSPKTVREKQVAKRYRLEETKDTKGVYFVTEDDLKEDLNNHYSFNAQQSIWGILRSYQRTKEIRGQGLVRFAVIPNELPA